MTFDRITLPDVTDDENRLVNRLLENLAAKEPRNFLRASLYDGKHAIRQVGTIIPPQYYRIGIVLGWSGKAVDSLGRRCNLDRMVWSNGDLDSLGLPELMDDNHLASEISGALTSSLIHATSFLVNTRGDESAGEPKSLIHAKDARSATGDWNNRARRMDNLVSVLDRNEEGQVTSLALYLDGLTITADKDSSGWSVDRSEHPWGVPVERLAYKPRPGRPFGSSRISRPIMSLHNQALRTVIRMEGHADVYSFPEMWLLGANESIFKNADGTQKAAWQVMLGRIKAIPDDDSADNPRPDVKQFSASSPQPHIDQLKWQAQMFAGEASISVQSLGVADTVNPSSADAIAEAKADLIDEAEGATDDWSPAIRRSVARGLAIQNGLSEVPREWRSIDAKWRSALHLSRAAAADAGLKVIQAHPWLAETEVGLEISGLDEQQIKRALAERRRLGGSAALRAITEAATAGHPAVTADGIPNAG